MTDHPFNPRRDLTMGDPVLIFRFRMTPGVGVEEVWIPATVVSNSDEGLAVAYADGTREVVEWITGRIRSNRT